MRRSVRVTLWLVGVLTLTGLVLSGCTSGTTGGGAGTGAPAASSGTTISEKGFAFNPADVTVKAGDTVTFTNDDSTAHNVTIDGAELGVQQPGESKTWTPSKDGTYPYSCVIHPSMKGQITVGAGGTPVPSGATSGGSAPPATGGY